MVQICRPALKRQQVVPSAQPAAQRAARPAVASATARRPQCTHINMTRLYGHHTCYLCGKTPTIGWVYSCQQDREQLERTADIDAFPVVPDESNYFDVQACLAETLGMGDCVIKGIRNGNYSFEQVEKLIEQKKHLLAVIRKIECGSADSTPQLHLHGNTRPTRFAENIIASVGTSMAPPVLPMASAGTPVNTPAESPIKRGSKSRKQTCNFQVCHACRPFFQDRLYMSFEKMLSGRVPAVTEEEISRLPMLNPAIVRNLGLRKQHPPISPTANSQESIDITTQQYDYEEDTSDWTPTSASVSEEDSDGLEMADSYPCPGAGVCPLWSRFGGCAYDSGFDDGFRALNHNFGLEPDLSRMTPENSMNRLQRVRGSMDDTPGGTSSTASSISLPTPNTMPLAPLTPMDESFDEALSRRLGKSSKAVSMLELEALPSEKRRTRRWGLGMRGKDSSSSLGSEVEVEGGVALTEEAVEMGTPDIATDGVSER